MKRNKVTIRDVAKEAGVSVGTVSRALNKAGRVKKSTMVAVAEAANKLGYEPDAIAQSMRKQSTGVIGMLISDIANPFFAAVIRAAETRLRKAGYVLLIGNTDNDTRREKELIDMFRRRQVDGLILGPCETDDSELVDQIARDYFPTVSFDRDFGLGGGVHIDHYGGAAQATRYLLNLGHKRISLISSSKILRPGRERTKAFIAAHEASSVEFDPQLIVAEPHAMEFVFSEALALINSNNPPTAYICLGTRILSAVLSAVHQAGLSIPEDVSIISIGDRDLNRLYSPPITSLTWSLETAGEVAAEVMLRQLSPDSVTEEGAIKIRTQLIQRQSCAPPKQT